MRYVFIYYFLVSSLFGAYSQQANLEFEIYDSDDYNLKGSIVHATEDKLGRMWFASNGGGVLIFDGYSFRNLVHLPKDSSTLISNNALSVVSLGDIMWVGNIYGFSTVNVHSLEVKNYQLGKLRNHEDDALRNYSEAIIIDTSGYWVSNHNRLIKLSKGFKELISFDLPKIGPAIAKTSIVRMIQDKYNPNRIWIGTLYGLFSFDKHTEEFENHLNPKKWHNQSSEMKQYGYWDMVQTEDSIIHAAAMHSGGLLSYNPSSKHWNIILYKSEPGQNPYLGNQAKSVGIIDDSTFILNMDLGIAFINRGDKFFKEWEGYDILKYGNSRDNYIDSKGYLWLCADNVILRSSEAINKDINTPILHLSSEMEGLNETQSEIGNLKRTGTLKVLLTLNNPGNRKKVEYQYQLCNSDWRSIGNQRIIDLFNIGYGHHTFRSRAKESESGEWIYAQPLEFEIAYPIYLKPFNLILFGILLFGIVFIFWKLTKSRAIREVKLKHSFEKKILETEMKALRSQMNPHFIFNSLNSIYNFILQNETEQAADYLSKFSKLIRRVLNNSKHQTIALEAEIQTLRLYLDLEMVRIQKKFEYNISMSSKVNSTHIFIPTMLIQPHLENAIWHGVVPKVGKGHLEMEINVKEDLLEVKITDNGVGRDHMRTDDTLKEKSWGSSITGERLRLLEKLGLFGGQQQYIDLFDEEGNSEGTQVILTIPFSLKKETL